MKERAKKKLLYANKVKLSQYCWAFFNNSYAWCFNGFFRALFISFSVDMSQLMCEAKNGYFFSALISLFARDTLLLSPCCWYTVLFFHRQSHSILNFIDNSIFTLTPKLLISIWTTISGHLINLNVELYKILNFTIFPSLFLSLFLVSRVYFHNSSWKRNAEKWNMSQGFM